MRFKHNKTKWYIIKDWNKKSSKTKEDNRKEKKEVIVEPKFEDLKAKFKCYNRLVDLL